LTRAVLALVLGASFAVRARSCGRSRAVLPRAGERLHRDVQTGLASAGCARGWVGVVFAPWSRLSRLHGSYIRSSHYHRTAA